MRTKIKQNVFEKPEPPQIKINYQKAINQSNIWISFFIVLWLEERISPEGFKYHIVH